jgi:hypothetical protein
MLILISKTKLTGSYVVFDVGTFTLRNAGVRVAPCMGFVIVINGDPICVCSEHHSTAGLRSRHGIILYASTGRLILLLGDTDVEETRVYTSLDWGPEKN